MYAAQKSSTFSGRRLFFSRTAKTIVGMSLVDLNTILVGKETYRTDKEAKHVEEKSTRLKTQNGKTSWNDRGRLRIDFPFDKTTGNKKLNVNWNSVIQNGSARKSLNAFCVPSSTISITIINEKYNDAYKAVEEEDVDSGAA